MSVFLRVIQTSNSDVASLEAAGDFSSEEEDDEIVPFPSDEDDEVVPLPLDDSYIVKEDDEQDISKYIVILSKCTANLSLKDPYRKSILCTIMMYYYSISLNVKDPGYSCWDNVQKLNITRHHLRQENKMMLWTLCFAAKNRISFRHLDDHNDKCSVRDIEIHVSLIISHLF